MPNVSGGYDYVTKVGDKEPAIEAVLEDANGDPKDLSNASGVSFHMKEPRSGTAKIDKAATITDAPNGVVQYSWDAEDVDEAGEFEAEFEVTWSDGDTETFPKDGFLDLNFLEPLA